MAEEEKAAEIAKLEEGADDDGIDDEIQALERDMAMMDAETQKVKEDAEAAQKDEAAAREDQDETDKRSVYVGNVDYGATPEELQEHFKSCGAINRITIMVDKFTCCPKGFAYMEFNDEAGVQNATLLNDSLFRGRQLKVVPKRTNLPGFNKGKGKKGGKKGAGKKGAKPAWGAPAGYGPAPWKGGKGKGKGYAMPYY